MLPEIALAKVNDQAPFDKICYIGCGVTMGAGAVPQHRQCRGWRHRFGLVGIGLDVIQSLRMAGAGMIIDVDINKD